jgi:ADP-ribose pyrophosphatase YjhB (NUDIX family)
MITQMDGLPEHLFAYISSITPMVNVDVLAIDSCSRFLLAWRDDGTYGPGWHIPGGIIRFKENINSRINAVCVKELGIEQYERPSLVQINQIMNPNRDYRGHFLSLLFFVRVQGDPPTCKQDIDIRHGDTQWFSKAPDNIIYQHKRYLPILNSILSLKDSALTSVRGNLLDNYNAEDERFIA